MGHLKKFGFILAAFAILILASFGFASDYSGFLSCSISSPSANGAVQRDSTDSIAVNFTVSNTSSNDVPVHYGVQIFDAALPYAFYGTWDPYPRDNVTIPANSTVSYSKTVSWQNKAEGLFDVGVYFFDPVDNREFTQVLCENRGALRVVESGNGGGNDNDSGNDAPNLSGIPDVEVRENSGSRSRLIDLFSYASDDRDSDSQLDFRITNQSNTSLIFCFIDDDRYVSCDAPRDDRTGSSSITVEVEDSSGRTDSDLFNVDVFSEDSGACSDLSVSTRTVFVDESDTTLVAFDIRNRADDDFTLEDVDFSESSSFISIRNVDFDDFIREGEDGELEFEIESSSVSSDREATVSIDLRGEFGNGRACSFSDFRAQSFRVVVENNGGSGSSGVCSNIEINSSNTTIPENARTRKVITVRNDTSRDFDVGSVRISESNNYFSASVSKSPSTIPANSSREVEITFDSDAVSSNRTGSAELTITGDFDNGRTCSGSSIRESFNVTVRDGASPDSVSPEPSGSVGISFSDSFVSLNADQSANVVVTLNNGLDSSQCFALSASSSNTSAASVSLSGNQLCLSSGSSGTVIMTLTGRGEGTANVQFEASYEGRTKSKFVSADVSASRPRISVKGPPEVSDGSAQVTLENTGSDISNVSITASELPEGVSFTEISKSLWRTGEQISAEIALGDYSGEGFTSSLRVSSDSGAVNVPVTVEGIGAPQDEGEGFAAGLFSLATTIGLVLGIIILIVLVIGGIIHFLSPASGSTETAASAEEAPETRVRGRKPKNN